MAKNKSEKVEKKKEKVSPVESLDIKRTITPTVFRMFSVVKDESGKVVRVEPVRVKLESMLCTQSQANTDKLEEKGKLENLAHGNPQQGDVALLDAESSVLRFKGGVSFGSACFDYAKIQRVKDGVGVEGQPSPVEKLKHLLSSTFGEPSPACKILSDAYAAQIGNCAFAFRNLENSKNFKVTVRAETSVSDDVTTIVFNSKQDNIEAKDQLSYMISLAFRGEYSLHLNIEADIEYYFVGVDVHPSQEFIGKEEGDSNKGRTYAKDAHGFAYLHSQKVGNAIRTIDSWHGDGSGLTIPVDAYGPCKLLVNVFRSPKGEKSLFSLLNKVYDSSIEEIDNMPVEDVAFIAANWIRGGLFGIPSQESRDKKAKERKAAEQAKEDDEE